MNKNNFIKKSARYCIKNKKVIKHKQIKQNILTIKHIKRLILKNKKLMRIRLFIL